MGDAARRLLSALAVSALLHALVLATLVRPLPWRFEGASQAIQAVMISRQAAMPVSNPPSAPATGGGVLARARVVSPEVPQRRLSREAVVRDGRAESLPAASAMPLPEPSPPEAGVASVGGAATVQAGVDPDDLRQYRMALAVAARRFKRYPPVARAHGWEGRVEVALSVSASQRVPRLSLVRSSGRAELDEQALTMIEQAAAATALPQSLQGREIRVLLPIEFTLENDR